MQVLFAIAGGGAAGSLLRYWLTDLIQGRLGHTFPYGTIGVNVLGCLLVGVVYALLNRSAELGQNWHALLIVGFMGGFTTFSAFSLATIQLLQRGAVTQAFANVFLSVLLSLAACWLGLWATERLA